jgi:hypothetical protein
LIILSHGCGKARNIGERGQDVNLGGGVGWVVGKEKSVRDLEVGGSGMRRVLITWQFVRGAKKTLGKTGNAVHGCVDVRVEQKPQYIIKQ